ncbi:MAG: ECF transporter S component [Bacilli bacterium]|jgi:riboflavin transporter FmnP
MKKKFEPILPENDCKEQAISSEKKVEECDLTPEEKKAIKRKKIIRFITRVGIFSAASAILYLLPFPPFKFSIFPAVSFLEVNFSEVPAMIAGFAYGPLAGFLVILIRFLIKIPFSATGAIGEFADLLFSTALVLSSAIIYQQARTLKNAFIAIIMGGLAHLTVAIVANFYFIIDWYNIFYGGHLLNENFTKEFYISWNIPFNVIKNVIVSVVTLLTYKRVHKLVTKITN